MKLDRLSLEQYEDMDPYEKIVKTSREGQEQAAKRFESDPVYVSGAKKKAE